MGGAQGLWAEDRGLWRLMEAALDPSSRTGFCTSCALGVAMSRHSQGSSLPLVVPRWFLTWAWQRRLGMLNQDTSVGTLEEGLSQRDLVIQYSK